MESVQRSVLRDAKSNPFFHYLEVHDLYLQVNALQSQDRVRVSVKAPEIIPKWGSVHTGNNENHQMILLRKEILNVVQGEMR